MKYFFVLVLLFAVGAGCKPMKPSTDMKLAEVMKGYLAKTLNPGTEINIKSLMWQELRSMRSYLCDFQVKLHRGD
jgi:hypothetical protein